MGGRDICFEGLGRLCVCVDEVVLISVAFERSGGFEKSYFPHFSKSLQQKVGSMTTTQLMYIFSDA